MQLVNTPGWATLMTILQESGERPPKRPRSIAAQSPRPNSEPGKHRLPSRATETLHTISPKLDSEQLAKRFKGASLD